MKPIEKENPKFRFCHPSQAWEMADFCAKEKAKCKTNGEILSALYRQCDYHILGWLKDKGWKKIVAAAGLNDERGR